MKKLFFFAFTLLSMTAVAAPQDKWTRVSIDGHDAQTDVTNAIMYATINGNYELEGQLPNAPQLQTDAAALVITRHAEDGSEKVTKRELAEDLPGVTFGLQQLMPNIFYAKTVDGGFGIDIQTAEAYVEPPSRGVHENFRIIRYRDQHAAQYNVDFANGGVVTGAPADQDALDAIIDQFKAHAVTTSATGGSFIFLPKGARIEFGNWAVNVTGDCYLSKSTVAGRPSFKDNSVCEALPLDSDRHNIYLYLPRRMEIQRNGQNTRLRYRTDVKFTIPYVAATGSNPFVAPADELKDLYDVFVAAGELDRDLFMQNVFKFSDKLFGMLANATANATMKVVFHEECGAVYAGGAYEGAPVCDSVVMHIEDFIDFRKTHPNAVMTFEVWEDLPNGWVSEDVLDETNTMIQNYEDWSYNCRNLELTDISYAPVKDAEHYANYGFLTYYDWNFENINAKNFSYKRIFNGGIASICLPFDFEVDGQVIKEVLGYDSFDPVSYSLVFSTVDNPVAKHGYFANTEAGEYVFTGTDVTVSQSRFEDDDYKPMPEDEMVGTFLTTEEYAGQLSVMANNMLFAPLAKYLHPFRACFAGYIPPYGEEGSNIAPRMVIKRGLPTGVEKNTSVKADKALVNGRIVIRRGANCFDATGRLVK